MPRGGAREQGTKRAPRPGAGLCAALAALAAAAALATAAHAQLGDPGEQTGVDTPYTPRAKDLPEGDQPQGSWRYVSGARYRGTTASPDYVPESSPTPFEVDFFDVASRGADKDQRAFAAGAQGQGERQPVIYAYSQAEGWQPSLLAEGEGYVAAIAFIDDKRALAVGGDGAYPRREDEAGRSYCAPDPPPNDPAGKPRAWLYEDGRWRELRDDELPAGMTALTALDFYPAPEGGPEFGIAGGLCQLWHWRDGSFLKQENGSFAEPYSSKSPESKLQNAPHFRFRVRSVGFAKPARGASFAAAKHAWAVTAGCCAPGQDGTDQGAPLLLSYAPPTDANQDPASGSWSLRRQSLADGSLYSAEGQANTSAATAETSFESGESTARARVGCLKRPGPGCPQDTGVTVDPNSTVDSACQTVPLGWLLCPFVPRPPGVSVPLGDESRALARQLLGDFEVPDQPPLIHPPFPLDADPESKPAARPNRLHPDSFYSLTRTQTGPGASFTALGVIASTGAKEADDEPASTIFRWSGTSSADELGDLSPETKALSTLRLASGDGDTGGIYPSVDVIYPPGVPGIPPFIIGGAHGLGTATGRLWVPPLSENAAACIECTVTLFGSPVVRVRGDGTGGDRLTGAPDGMPDFSVGVLRSSAQGMIFATNPARLSPNPAALAALPIAPADPLADIEQAPERASEYQPTSADRTAKALASYRLLKAPTYALNAIAIDDRAGGGWAVGDHGAILAFQDDDLGGGAAKEPPSPTLGAPRPGRLAERDPYEAHRPTSPPGEAGPVPPLASRPLERLAEPRLVPTGPGGGAGQIVMSRDGEEGWAIGGGTLSHYDGAAWTPCAFGSKRPPLADPACPDDSLGFLPGVAAAARVPLENDSDPSNDDEFELVANPGRIVRYRGHERRWSYDDADTQKEVKPISFRDIAFTAPDDGWMLGSESGSASARPNMLFHFTRDTDGVLRWISCDRAGHPCDAAEGRYPTDSDAASGSHGTVEGIVAAGDRVYAYGRRDFKTNPRLAIINDQGTPVGTGSGYPMIIYRERGQSSWVGDTDEGAYDPGFGKSDPGSLAVGGPDTPIAADTEAIAAAVVNPDSANQGQVESLAITRDRDGRYHGWAVGSFGGAGRIRPAFGNQAGAGGSNSPRPEAALLRLGPEQRWSKFRDDGAAGDYLSNAAVPIPTRAPTNSRTMAVSPPQGGEAPAFIGQGRGSHGHTGRILTFNAKRRRWAPLTDAARPPNSGFSAQLHSVIEGPVQALAPDQRGGLWAAIGGYFFHYTKQPPKEVFTEAPHPIANGRRLIALAGAPDGSLWAATGSSTLYRYDRLTGWDQVSVPGWDPGRVVTRASKANAIALGPDGSGLAVGEGGRIAQIGPREVRLDPAAGVVCDRRPAVPPCATSRDLHAVAVAPDGSAIVGGDQMALAWRPAGGEFRAIERPLDVAPGTRIAKLAMPRPGRAWLVTNGGQLFAGELDGAVWRWRLEASGIPSAFALDAQGHGYAVGGGLVLERTGDGAAPWRQVQTGFGGSFTSVALPAAGGPGALIGGANGVVLTLHEGRFQIARQAEPLSGTSGTVIDMALLPGVEPGQAEAWAAIDAGGAPPRLLHYTSDPAEPLLDAGARARPIPDTPAPRAGELAFAAFGKSECHGSSSAFCTAMLGTTAKNEVVARRVVDELIERRRRAGGPAFALFTGDVNDSASLPAASETEAATGEDAISAGPRKLRRWSELIADRLEDGGVPLYGAIGGQDLSEAFACDLGLVAGLCVSTKEHAKSGENTAWRQVMARHPAPWGAAAASPKDGRFAFKPVKDSVLTRHVEDVRVRDPDGDNGPAPEAELPTGGARTHYAVDVFDRDRGSAVARLVFVDTSLRSLSASDPLQQPQEAVGQARWLEEVLCVEGSLAATGRCTRKPSQRAIVVSNTPTYSYGPGAGTDTQTDATAFEALLLKHRASVVVSGRLGWNGLYWATAPGVHEPCPGGEYQETPPTPGARICGRSQADLPADPSERAPAAGALSNSLRALAPGPPPAVDEAVGAAAGTGVLPFVVASGAGGKFGPKGESQSGEARDGFWHGYTIVRTDPSGDPRGAIVEQRPILDWVGIAAQEHVLRPGQRLTLRGTGREPLASDGGGRSIRIDSPAITHRYDLLEADPGRPWLPREGADGSYVPLDPSIATVDSQTGRIRAGRGNHPRQFAIGMLSVADHVATWPLVFEPRRSFRPKPAAGLPALPLPKVAASAAAALQSPQAPPPVNPPTPQVNLPAPPTIPPLPTPSANPPAPPAPPAPPPPPVSPSATPLDLVTSPVGLNVAPQATVIPPPAPPIQPAPPGGARREARQRQAATQKSGADGVGSGADAREVDIADSPRSAEGAQATRRDRIKPAPDSITILTNHTQPSAWPRNLAYGGGLTLASILLAGAWLTARPRPRRPRPHPAPAYLRRPRD